MACPALRGASILVSQLREGDPYELSEGQLIECLPTGPRGGTSTVRGGAVLDSDPAAAMTGRDVGFELGPRTMRAPDVSVGDFADDTKGFAKAVPALALEYADSGQDEADLRVKIGQLFAAGTRLVWVVRLVGQKHVEVFEPGLPVRRVDAGGFLSAPGILANAVPAESLWDREAAHEATLRNLLQRRGFESLEHVREAGVEAGLVEGKREAVADLVHVLGLELDEARRSRLLAMSGRELDELRVTLRSTRAWPADF